MIFRYRRSNYKSCVVKSSSSDGEKKKTCVVACAVMVMRISNDKEKKRRIWQKSWLSDRKKYCHMPLLRDLRDNHSDDFNNYLRMNSNTFDQLLNVMKPYLSKHNTTRRFF